MFDLESNKPAAARCFGVEIPLGSRVQETGNAFRPTKRLRKLLQLPRRGEHLDLGDIESRHLAELGRTLTAQVPERRLTGQPALVEFCEFDGVFHARFDLSAVEAPAVEDSLGRFIVEPHERTLTQRADVDADTSSAPAQRAPRPG